MGQKLPKDRRSMHIFKQTKANIVVIGVRKSGLSSIMAKILPSATCGSSSAGNAVTTMSPCKGVNLTMWSIGFGHDRPPLWKYHLKNAEGLLLVIDSGNRRTFASMKDELKTIFDADVIASSHLPVVVLANKADLKSARPASDIADALSLYDYGITWNVQPCNAVTGEGLVDGVRKLFQLVKMRKTIPTKRCSVDPASKYMTI